MACEIVRLLREVSTPAVSASAPELDFADVDYDYPTQNVDPFQSTRTQPPDAAKANRSL